MAVDTERAARRYVVISTDGHCGADLWDYKPYLEARLHQAFDDWAGTFADGWADADRELLDGLDRGGDRRFEAATIGTSLNWDSGRRQAQLEAEGIVGEVLFPNTAPPFYPSGSIGVPSPRTKEEYERRLPGIRAHNRWLADFCAETPGRRAGIAQVFLNDVDTAIAEITWAREHGLRGVLLPSDHLLQMANLYYPAYDRFWAACCDLDLPVVRHGLTPAESAAQAGPAAPISALFEAYFFAQRGIDHLVFAGVFERYPALKFVVTEAAAAWILPYGAKLDFFVQQAAAPGTILNTFGREAAAGLRLLPSEYIARNCYFGTFLNEADMAARHDVGVERIMWGADFPHQEGTSPFTTQALRVNFAGVDEDEVRTMTSRTAAEVYGFDLDALQVVADRIGPSVEEIARPLERREYPSYPAQTQCATFARTLNGNDG